MITNNIFRIHHKLNYMSKNIIYLLDCTGSQKQYVRKSEWPFYFRLNEETYDQIYGSQQLAEEHFRSNVKIAITERIEKDIIRNQ